MVANIKTSSKLRVLFFMGFILPFPGAAWTRIGFIANAWSKQGHTLDVIGIFTPKSLRKRGLNNSDKVNIYNVIFSIELFEPFGFLLNALFAFIFSTFILVIKRPNKVVVSMPKGDTGLGVIMACKILKIKCVVDYRDQWEDYAISVEKNSSVKAFHYLVKKFMLRLYSSSSAIICVTSAVKSYLENHGIKNVKLLTNGADARVFRPVKRLRNSDDLVLVYVNGPIYYNVTLVLKALSLLLKQNRLNLKLFFIGKMTRQIMSNISNLKIGDNVSVFGEISDHKKLSEIIAQGDIGLLPLSIDYVQSKTALPVKLFEYCACGLPVIATASDDSILAELIRENNIGLTVSSSDEMKFVDAISELYMCEAFRKAAGIRARALVEERFDRNEIAKKYLTLLEGL